MLLLSGEKVTFGNIKLDTLLFKEINELNRELTPNEILLVINRPFDFGLLCKRFQRQNYNLTCLNLVLGVLI